MSLKRNVVANYASQIYVTLVGLIMVPIYLRFMGAEAYGLVGFFGMLQGLLQLMDLGLSATLSREVTCYRAGGLTEKQLNALLRSLTAFFVCIAFLTAIAIWLMSDWIAVSWLQTQALPRGILAKCLTFMGLAAALRWIAGLYRSILVGWERQVWLGGYSIVVATIRYVGVLAVFLWVDVDPLTFFSFQLLVAVGELLIIWWEAGSLLSGARAWPSFDFEPLRAMWRFSGALAFCTVVWIFVTHADKLVLSKTLTLADYGYFTLAMTVANAINMVSAPVSSTLMPRLTYLAAQGDSAGHDKLYRNATQWVSLIVWPTASIIAFFAEPLLLVWTKNSIAAKQAAPVLFWYVLGNAFLCLGAFQFYVQFARGKLRLHMIGNAIFVVVLIPGVLWASINYGAVGAGRMWFSENLLFFLVWTWVVHRRFVPGLHWHWLGKDVLPIALCSGIVSWVLSQTVSLSAQRYSFIVQIISFGALSLAAAVIASSTVRGQAQQFILGKKR